ncbi:MAG: AMIN domain-containing protein, partial [Bacillati bacterium ANGP1]
MRARTLRLHIVLIPLLVALLVVPSVVTAPVQAGPMRVTQVTVREYGTRLVVGIVTTGQILFNITEIETPLPPRVAIDILNAVADDRVRVATDVKKGNVLRVRVGQFQDSPPIARVVVDLVRAVHVDVQRSAPNILAVSVPLHSPGAAEVAAAVSTPIPTPGGSMVPAVSAPAGTGLIKTAQQPIVPGAPAGPGLIRLLEFRGVSMADVLSALSKLCGFNLVTDSSVQGTITLRLLDVTCEEALRYVLEANGLAFRRLGKNLIVGSAEKLAPPPEVPETIAYHLSYGDVNAIRAAVAAAVPGVRVAVDPRTNGLLITGTSAQHEEVVKVLGTLDVRIPQVVIQVSVVEVNITAVRGLGLWSGDTAAAAPGGIGFGNVMLDSASRRLTFNLVSSTLLNFNLRALVNEGKAKILTSPRIATLDGNKATIQLATRVPVFTTTTQQGVTTTTISYIDVGVKLVTTPRVNTDNLITLSLT